MYYKVGKDISSDISTYNQVPIILPKNSLSIDNKIDSIVSKIPGFDTDDTSKEDDKISIYLKGDKIDSEKKDIDKNSISIFIKTLETPAQEQPQPAQPPQQGTPQQPPVQQQPQQTVPENKEKGMSVAIKFQGSDVMTITTEDKDFVSKTDSKLEELLKAI